MLTICDKCYEVFHRCGSTFCPLHRYAEEHNCSYDYKTEGKNLLTQTNPVVTAPNYQKFEIHLAQAGSVPYFCITCGVCVLILWD